MRELRSRWAIAAALVAFVVILLAASYLDATTVGGVS